MQPQDPYSRFPNGPVDARTKNNTKLILALVGAIVVLVFLVVFVGFLALRTSANDSPSNVLDNSTNVEPGSGPDYKGKRPADIGAVPGTAVSYDDIEFEASEVEYTESTTAFLLNSYCTTVTIVNNSDSPFSIAHTDFSMRFPYGTSTTPNGLNDVDRLDPQTIPPGGSTFGSLCYQVPSVVDDRENPTFSYIGDGLGGTRIGWSS